MQIEHIAINIKEPRAFAEWWSTHLGLEVVRADDVPPYITFLADDGRQTLIEVYANPVGEFPDYGAMSFFTFHIAFAVDDITAECERLIAAGATADGGVVTMPNGDQLGIVRDPWGIAIQFIKRVRPLV